MNKNLIDSSVLSAFSWHPKNHCFWPSGQSGRYSSINDQKRLYLENLFIDSDREKNSASNVTIFNRSFTGIDGVLGQKLIFRSFL